MKNKTYAPTSLDNYINESKTLTLKRSYGSKPSVTVGSKAPIRNQIIAYVAESRRVAKTDLRNFIAGLNEGKTKPAAANMWIKRNSKFFITENKNGVTYFKLSKIGQRLAGMVAPKQTISESKKPGKNIRRILRANESENPFTQGAGDLDEDAEYDFLDKKKGYGRPGIYSMEEEEACEGCEEEVIEETIDPTKGKKRMFRKSEWENLLENEDKDDDKDDDDKEDDKKKGKKKDKKDEEISESTKAKFKKILENKLNEEEDEIDIEDEDAGSEVSAEEEDEFSFDDLDLGGEDEEVGDDEGEEEVVDVEDDEAGAEEGEDFKEEGDDDTTKVEITAFEITVDDPASAIAELEELGISAEEVENDEGEQQIKVQAEDWEVLKGWLEEKDVDIEEMFGGEIEVQEDDVVTDLGDEREGEGEGDELDSEEFDLDFGDIGDEGGDEEVSDDDAGEDEGDDDDDEGAEKAEEEVENEE